VLLLIPLGPETDTPRLPRVTAALLLLNAAAFALTAPFDAPAAAREEAELEQVADWTLRTAARDAPALAEARARHPSALAYLAREDGWRGQVAAADSRERLESVLADHRALTARHPFYRFGFIPGAISLVGLVTHQFLHFDFLHLIFNAIFLWAVGGLLELTWGAPVFASFYLVGGVAAALAHALSAPGSLEPAIGASGAVSALMGAYLVTHGRQPMRLAMVAMLALAPRISFFSLPAAAFLGLWVLEQVFWTLMSQSVDLGVAFWAHLGGFAFGCAAGLLLRARRAALVTALLAAALAPAAPAHALDPGRRLTQYVHEHWRVADGLPQGSIQAMVQARDGYLWLGTLEGLARFDGVRFTVFDRGTTRELPHNDVQALCEDDSGRLWIGTWGGLAVREAGRFRTVALAGSAAGVPVNALAAGRSGELWIATTRGLIRLAAGGEQRAFGLAEGLPTEDAVALLRDGAGTLWVGTSAGLVRLAGDRLEPAAGVLGRTPVVSLYEDHQGTLWVGAAAGGVYRAPRGDVAAAARQAGPPDERILSVLEDRDGNHWFGTASHGVLRWRDGVWRALARRDGLSFDVVLTLLEDREGAVWIGTDGGGLDRLRDGKLFTVSTAEGLPHDLLWTVYEDRRGVVWMGTAGGGLIRAENGVFRQVSAPEGLPSRRFMAMAEDAQGTLWVGGWGDGLFRWDGERLRRVHRDPAFVTALLFDRDGTAWVGSEKEGLAALRNGELTRYGVRQGMPSENVRALHLDPSGDLWVGTDEGLVRIARGRASKLTVFTTRDGLPHNTVTDIHQDAEGMMWLGTYGGGLVMRQGERFFALDRARGLHDDVVYRVLEDGQGRFWLSSNRGLFSVPRQELLEAAAGRRPTVRSVAYDASDGMRHIECQGFYQPAGWKTRDGRLLFPTIQGLVVVEPQRMRLNPLPPPVTLESLRANGAPVAAEGAVELPPGRTDLEFHYTALSLLQPARVAFRYRLEGFDDAWVEAAGRRVAYYTNVPPGTYRFQVQAANNDGVWNERGAALELRLRPLFRQTPLFYALSIAGVGLAVFGLHRLRVAHLHGRQRRLEAMVEDGRRDLVDTNRKLQDAYEQLALLATEDALTGAFNRRYFEGALEQEWRRAARERSAISILMLDIDHFKKLNDAYGHPTGDECLRLVAAALQKTAQRPADVVARFGGEEFVVLLPATDATGGKAIAERMRMAVEGLGFAHRASSYGHVTVSVGLATAWPGAEQAGHALIERADQALYRAKEGGRNRVVGEGDPATGP
jgi:diguanylate cyclase (GGDEF)-like protein